MPSFPVPGVQDRTYGAAPGAAGDGIHQGAAYSAIISSEPKGTEVEVTIPSLHETMAFRAVIRPESGADIGDHCLIIFDETKNPWIVTITS